MKKKLRRLLSLVLVVALCLSMSTTALASELPDDGMPTAQSEDSADETKDQTEESVGEPDSAAGSETAQEQTEAETSSVTAGGNEVSSESELQTEAEGQEEANTTESAGEEGALTEGVQVTAENAAASIGDGDAIVYYETLEKAVLSVESDSIITLQKDVVLNNQIIFDSGKTLTLDLNGKTITENGTGARKIVNRGNLTIQDSSTGGSIQNTTESSGGNGGAFGLVDNYGMLTISDGCFVNYAKGDGAAIKNRSGAVLLITGGVFTGEVTDDAREDAANALVANDGTLTITGGTFSTSSKVTPAIKQFSGIVSISNAAITNEYSAGMEIAGGTANVANCAICILNTNSYYASAVAASGGAEVTISEGVYISAGYGVYVYNSGGTITIENGTIEGQVAAVRADISNTSVSDATINIKGGTIEGGIQKGGSSTTKSTVISVTGGTFDTDVSDYVADGYKYNEDGSVTESTPEEYVASVTSGEITTNYETFVDAIGNLEDGDTLKLLCNTEVTLNDTGSDPSGSDHSLWSMAANVTFDLSGYTLTTISNYGGSYNVLNVLASGWTIKNGSIVAKRTDDSYDSYALAAECNSGVITVENVNITGGVALYDTITATFTGSNIVNATNYYCIYAEGATAILEGGTYTSNGTKPVLYAAMDSSIQINSGSYVGTIFDGAGNITIAGGTFSNEVPEEYCADGYIPTASTDENGNTIYSVKEGAYVASVTLGEVTTNYETFAEAYNAASEGSTIKLLKDADWISSSTSVYIYIRKNLTIDLNGHTLSLVRESSSSGFYLYLDTAEKTLTIKDSGENGKLTTESSSYVARLYKGNLILESGTLEATKATRTVYLSSTSSLFTMNGGVLINASPKSSATNSANANVLEVSSGTAIINAGSIMATNENEPIPCAKVSGKAGYLTVKGGTFITGADRVIWNSSAGSLNVTDGNFENCIGASVYVQAAGNTVIGEESDSDFTLPELALNNVGVVTVKDNVIVNKVSSIEVSGSTDYTFRIDNEFGGRYGNDFTQNIIGNGLECQKLADSEYYQVVQLKEDDERIVAVITDSENEMSLFCDFGAAMTALKNGDTLTLKQNVENTSTSSWRSTAANVTIDLNGHNVTSGEANYGLYFNPVYSNISEGDTVKIVGSGTITGKNYGMYCSTNGSSSTGPIYTVSIGKDVQLAVKTDEAASQTLVGLMSQHTRLYMEAGSEDYTMVTNGRIMTEINNNTYIYYDLTRAVNDQPSSGGTVELLGDHNSTKMDTVINTGVVTLKLNEHKLTHTAQGGLISNGAGLIIENGVIEHNYNSSSASRYGYALGITGDGKDGSVLTLKNVIIEEKSSYAVALTANGSLKNVQVTLENCTINCNGTNDTVGIYFPVNGGILDITDTVITANNAVQIKGGTVTVDGDKTVITSNGAAAEPSAASNGCTNTGDGIYVEDTYGYNPIVYVKGGTVGSTGEGTSALKYFDNSQENATGRIEVSGGVFSTILKPEYCAEGYTPTGYIETLNGYTVEAFVLGKSDSTETVPATIYSGDGTSVMFVKVSSENVTSYSQAYPTTTRSFTNNLGKTCNYIFAGWYEDAEGSVPCANRPTTEAYAKFVDSDILTVKAQISNNVAGEGEADKRHLRMVTTVDSLDYQQVGFVITINGKTIEKSSSTVYKNIVAGANGVAFNYEPNSMIEDRTYIFSASSAYFMTFTITNISEASFNTNIEVIPYWVTLDGSKVTGTPKILTIQQGLDAALQFANK